MIKVPERFYERISSLNNFIMRSSTKNIILIIMIVWLLLYIPTSLYFSLGQKDSHFAYYPHGASPEGFTYKDHDVWTSPVPLNNSIDGRLEYDVTRGEVVEFIWIAHDYDSPNHIGVVTVYYSLEGEQGEVRLKCVGEHSETSGWMGSKTFERNGTISYYYRVDKNDIPVFNRRASVIIEGGNLYEDVRTGPPPLINFFFVVPALFVPSTSLGGAFLPFHLYFSIFVLIDSILLFIMFERFNKWTAFLTSILFFVNPITLFNIHQDEPIIAFTILLPFYLMLQNRYKISSFFAGLSVPVKVWGGFMFPLYLIKRDRELKERILLLSTACITTTGVLGIFYLLWGPKTLWFLGFYSGTAEKMNITRLSFWPHLLDLLGMDRTVLPRKVILSVIGLSGIYILHRAYKKGWGLFITSVSLLSIFFALYPKLHWSYYILLFPFLLYFAVRDKRYFAIFISSVALMYFMMIVASLPFSFSPIHFFLLTITISALLLLVVYVSITDETVAEKENEEIWSKL